MDQIAEKIAEEMVRGVAITLQGGTAIGLFEPLASESNGNGNVVGSIEVTATAEMCGWFYHCDKLAAGMKFLLQVNDPEPVVKELRGLIAEAVSVGIEQYRKSILTWNGLETMRNDSSRFNHQR